MHWERKSLCDSLYYNIHFITVVWNWTHNTCKLCICMSVSPIWPKVWFKFNISLFIFCMDDISIVEREVLRFFTVVFLSMPHFRFLSVCLKYLRAPILKKIFRHSNLGYKFIHNCYIFLMNWSYYYITTIFVFCYHFWLKSVLSDINISHPCFLLVPIGMECLLSSFHFEPMCVLKVEVNLFESAYGWMFFLFFVFLIHSATLCLLIEEFYLLLIQSDY